MPIIPPQPKLETKKVSSLKLHPRNPRTIEPEAFEALKESLRRYGLYRPPVWNKRFKWLIAGNQTVKALKELGVESVSVSVVDYNEKEDLEVLVNDNNRFTQGMFTEDLKSIINEIDDSTIGVMRFDNLMKFDIPRESNINLADEDVPLPDDTDAPLFVTCPKCGHEF